MAATPIPVQDQRPLTWPGMITAFARYLSRLADRPNRIAPKSVRASAKPKKWQGQNTKTNPGNPGPSGTAKKGTIALVGAGPGARDLLTLRAVDRLKNADVVYYDRLVDRDVLNLARPDARLIYAGKRVGAHDWPQEQIDKAIVDEALSGHRVVRLKSGDPGIFGRASEELLAARAAGIDVEMVPGITAACAAAAQSGFPLTERGVADTLVLTTGASRAGDPLPDSARYARPGTTLAFYMSVGQSLRIRDSLLDLGIPADTRMTIAADVSKPSAQTLTCRICDLSETLARGGITGCATLIVTWPKTPGSGSLPSRPDLKPAHCVTVPPTC